MKIIKKLNAILNSRKEYKQELTQEQQRRLKICSKCPFNSDNNSKLTIKAKIFLFLNKTLNRFYGLRVTYNAICILCGCGLGFLTTQEEEENKCHIKRW